MFSAAGKTAAVATAVNYIEDVFSTWLYTGNGSTQTITTGIDLAGKGGMLWIKNRSSATNNIVNDTARGAGKNLMTNSTSAEFTNTDNVSALSSTGFSVGVDSNTNGTAGNLYASWTFRKQPKFFDVVTWTGNGSNPRNISHNLGSTPGCIIAKNYSSADSWYVYHRSIGATQFLVLNSTDSATTFNTVWANTTPTSTQFTVGATLNSNGTTYVAYLFAHDAGGFGLTGTDNVISCGSFSGNTTVTLGYEPQFVMVKRSDDIGNWFMQDNMRGIPTGGVDATLFANLDNAENTSSNRLDLTATGFTTNYGAGTYIYIAIRRGPMKTPTTGTSVFSPNAVTGNALVTTNFPVDSAWIDDRGGGSTLVTDRLRGSSQTYYNNLSTTSTAAENTGTGAGLGFDNNTGYQMNAWGGTSQANINWNFRRAPGFFDVVCYTGTGVDGRSLNHNLGAVPELMIVKTRSGTTAWQVYVASLGVTTSSGLLLNSSTSAQYNTVNGFYATPTSSVFYLGTGARTNVNGETYVNYLFATCAGVSKVGSYTGTGTTKQIDCGFTGGARFVLIKRTDDTGDWYVWDSARGIVAGNDSYLVLNSTAAEVTNTDWVDTYSAGFELSNAAGNNVNINTATYIFLSVA